MFFVMNFMKTKLAGVLGKGQGHLTQSLAQHESLTNVLILGPHHCSKGLFPKELQDREREGGEGWRERVKERTQCFR